WSSATGSAKWLRWQQVFSSTSGQYAVAASALDHSITPSAVFYSKDYGVTWHLSSVPLVETSEYSSSEEFTVVISHSGQFMAAVLVDPSPYNPVQYPIFLSIDFG